MFDLQAFNSICDLLIIFSHQLEHESPGVAPLVFKPDKGIMTQLQEFIQNKVFTEIDEDEGTFNLLLILISSVLIICDTSKPNRLSVGCK